LAEITVIKWDLETAALADFKTTTPYAYLDSIPDPFIQNIKREEIAAAASKLGFKTFKKAYEEYKKSIKQGSPRADGKQTEFQDQPIELNCGNWTANDSGVKIDSEYGPIEACSHAIEPTQRLINIDTDTEKLTIWYRRGKTVRSIIVEKSVLASPQSIIKLSDRGIAVNSENAKAMIKYLADLEAMNYMTIPEKRSVSRLGWIPKYGFSPYVDDLEFDGDQQFRTAFESVSEHGKYKEWLKTAQEARRGSQTARIVIAASFASALVEICGCLPFFVHLWSSDSGTGKTVALMVAASVWANPTVGTYIQTFNSTIVGREKMAAFCNSLPLCIDELQLGKDNHGKQQFDVYALAEGVGKTRGTKTGGIEKTATWRNCILTTGETPITTNASGAGALNRVIDVECKSGEVVIKDGNKVVESVKKHYGHAGKMFIEKIHAVGEEHIRQVYQGNYSDLMTGDTTEKQAMAAALILTADQLADEWIFGMEAAPKDADILKWPVKRLYPDDIQKFLLTKAQVDVNARAYEFVCDWIATNRNRFGAEQGDIYGMVEGDTAYIIPTVFQRALDSEGYSYAGFLGWLKGKELIQRGDGRNWTIKRRIGNSTVRFIGLRLPESELFPDI